jgi:hypothetical protein
MFSPTLVLSASCFVCALGNLLMFRVGTIITLTHAPDVANCDLQRPSSHDASMRRGAGDMTVWKLLWGFNGFFQGLGWPAASRLLFAAFTKEERGSSWLSWHPHPSPTPTPLSVASCKACCARVVSRCTCAGTWYSILSTSQSSGAALPALLLTGVTAAYVGVPCLCRRRIRSYPLVPTHPCCRMPPNLLWRMLLLRCLLPMLP